MNKQQLANKIWESANKMRSKIEANEYKDYILGFIFYKFLSEKELKFLKENDFQESDLPNLTEDDQTTVEFVKERIGFFISYENLFSTWLQMGADFNVSNVRDALSAFSRLISPQHKKVFNGIFDTLQTGLSKLGDSAGSQTKAISDLIHLIRDIPMDSRQDYDVLGYIYEYLIGKFAANAGKKAGEFYTPHEVSLLMSEIVANHLKDREAIQIYDPTSGSGSLLINIGRCMARYLNNPNGIKYYAQELKQNTYNLTRMNLVMRGILPDNIFTRNADTLENDWPFFDESDPVHTYSPLYADAVVSNPPYSQNWDPSNKENDPRYSSFGLAPKTKADYAFLLHDLYHVKPNGIMAIVLPHGVLFRGGEEGQIRRNLVEQGFIDTIIGLPPNIFFGTGIPTIIMVLRRGRENNDILFIDASKGFEKDGKTNRLRASDIRRIVDTVVERREVPKFSRIVGLAEIVANDYNLNIPRYVDSPESAESWDIYSLMFGGIPNSEIDALSDFWQAFPALRESLFQPVSEAYSELSPDSLRSRIEGHQDVQHFISRFTEAFANFGPFLKSQLIDQWETLEIPREENVLSAEIFHRLADFPLVDPYEAFQLLDDEWKQIAGDLEILQTEGFNALRKVDPKMVTKKKGDKEVEVQDGWLGHVFPFELVQKNLLTDETNQLAQMEERQAEIASELEELLDSLSEEEKESEMVNEAGDAFVLKEINKYLKELKGQQPETGAFEEKLTRAADLIAEDKTLRSKSKKAKDALENTTKETIESLTDEKALQLLEQKWVKPLSDTLLRIPSVLLRTLTAKLQALGEKYAVTFEQVEIQIHDTQDELSSMLSDLTGNEFDLRGLEEFRRWL